MSREFEDRSQDDIHRVVQGQPLARQEEGDLEFEETDEIGEGILSEVVMHRILIAAIPAAAALLIIAILDATLLGANWMYLVLPLFLIILTPLIIITVRDFGETEGVHLE